jgi:S1-C subfamily serine protease
MNGTKIISQDALSNYLVQNTVPGQVVNVGIIRSGSPTTLTLVLGARPTA